ncbi:MAG TPA: MerR family transcriptional regulator [Ktedonobacterales bacterium]|nr:MerR family transcriptional regulator [Ktedonobacterales bacterium]
MTNFLRTTDLARAAGVHSNTVRRYEQRGLLPPAERGANGYRRFSQRHLDCLRVARAVQMDTYPGRAFRVSAAPILRRALADDWAGALERGDAHLAFVRAERAQAEAAAELLEGWAAGSEGASDGRPLRIGQVARLLGVSIDMLRNWERNGLITIPRNDENRYRAYRPTDISRLRVIRLLSRVGYSHMAILRMMLQLDRGERTDLRRALDTPRPDEDVYGASDRWLSTLATQEEVARRLASLLAEIVTRRS